MRDTPQNHYWASTVRDSWLDVLWGMGCIFVSPNPHPAVESAGLKSRRVIKRPLLVDRHRRTRLAWCLARRGWWSAGSWQVFHIVGLCAFSHQSADYSIVVARLTSNSVEGHPCCMHANYLPSLCFYDIASQWQNSLLTFCLIFQYAITFILVIRSIRM
jgi:hypothetical protein